MHFIMYDTKYHNALVAHENILVHGIYAKKTCVHDFSPTGVVYDYKGYI